MLQHIRERSSGLIAYLILGAVIVTMAFFGIDAYFSPKVETYAAKIEGPAKFLIWGKQEREISQQQFRNRFDQARFEERTRLGDEFDSAAFESIDTKRLVLEGLVEEELLALVAEREGIAISEVQVAEQLKAMPEFQVNGAYSADQYRLVLAGQGLTHGQFMARMRADMARRTLPSQIIASALASETELDRFLRLNQQTRDLLLIDLPTPALPEAPPTEEELRAWFDANAAMYRSEEQVAIEYVEIDGATLDVPQVADEQTLRNRYEQLGSRYVTAPRRVASHILLTSPANADAAADAAVRDQAAELAELARAPGADFAALAREHSQDVGSSADGGDLGQVDAGVFDPAFEAALFALEEAGQTTEPVRTPDGWHVIQLREITPGSERPFEEVRAEIEAEFLAEEAERRFSDLSGQLIDRVYKDPTALAPAAEASGLEVKRTGLFGRGQAGGIAAIPAVREAAFDDRQRIERQVSDIIEIGDNHVVVLHVVEHVPEAALAFEDVRERVLADLNGDRLAKASQSQAEALLARAQAGESLDELATEVGRTVADLAGVGRRGELPPQLLEEAFRLAPPEEDGRSFGIAQLAPDRHVLIAVTAVTDGEATALEPEVREMLQEQFAQARGLVEYQAYMKALRQHYAVTVAEDRL
jgi:peptidyl-prolyl cis-trans isomerase D